MKKQETIELLKLQLPGFYSVEQVIALLKVLKSLKLLLVFQQKLL